MVKKNKTHFILRFLICLVMLSVMTPVVFAFDSEFPFASYTYTRSGDVVYVPSSVEVEDKIFLSDQSGQPINTPADLVIDKNQHIIVSDPSENRVLAYTFDGEIVWELSTIDQYQLYSPNSVAIDGNGNYYICDDGIPDQDGNTLENGRIFKLDQNRNLLNVFEKPAIKILDTTEEKTGYAYPYIPLKLSVDNRGRMYVIGDKINQGFIQLDKNGNFKGFIGAPDVKVTLGELIIRFFSTEAQKDRIEKLVPTEYSSVDIDSQGFLYAICKTVESDDVYTMIYTNATSAGVNTTPVDVIRRLNPVGDDVLLRRGGYSPAGDLRIPGVGLPGTPVLSDEIMGGSNAVLGVSRFNDVKVMDSGIYFALDSLRNRVFAYDKNGLLLMVFGASGSRFGSLKTPVAVEQCDDKILILNQAEASVSIFRFTDYGNMIINATREQEAGNYSQAQVLWQSILDKNKNCEIAYDNIGKIYYNNDDNKTAMEYFKLASDRVNYSKAFKKYRSEVVEDNFFLFAGILIAVIVLLVIFKKLIHRLVQKNHRLMEISKKFQYIFYTNFHPFDGFWDLKHEKNKGNVPISISLIMLYGLTNVLVRTCSPYIFQVSDIRYINVIVEFITAIAPFFLFVVANWGFTTLMNGKGSFKDILRYIGYCVVPMLIGNLLYLLLSTVLSLDEQMVLTLINGIAMAWTLFLIFIATMVTHDYSMKKNILTLLLTVFGIVIILFVALFLNDIFSQFVEFIEMTIEDLGNR